MIHNKLTAAVLLVLVALVAAAPTATTHVAAQQVPRVNVTLLSEAL
jgi:hypothetical protein